mmetsp:Transcript_2064/g.3779  ORF Transcript_2064/g.3779 Transcript_2064/m.3779 type:complete len:819 (+) Transcript_2064:168-2624(+)
MASLPASSQLLRIPRSLTAPDAWITILLASFLQYRQYKNARVRQQRKIHSGAKPKPKRNAPWLLVHECLFTNLSMFVSPLSGQASNLNAEMVDLKDEGDLDSYARKVAASGGKVPKTKKQPKGNNNTAGKAMEVRSRRITRGEMMHNAYYPAVETTLNLACSIIIGMLWRWMLGLIRSLNLSSAPGGHCCSPYRGGDDVGTREAGSFLRLLACVLMKKEGDEAGTLIFSIFMLVFFMVVIHLAWSVSTYSASKNDDVVDGSDADNKKKGEGNEVDMSVRRINPAKAKRFVMGVVATVSSLWLFHTPAMLRILGLDGLTEAVEELAARIFLFGNLLGIVSLPQMDTLEEPPELVQHLMNGLLVILAFSWGYIASGMMGPVMETARNAAYVLSPSASKRGKRAFDPKEMLDLINVRMMLVIQAMAPFIIACTYFFSARFNETAVKGSVRSDNAMSISKQYFRNSGLFVRVALSWCFVGAALYTFKPLLQSFLDQATAVASAMGVLGGDSVKNDVGASSRGTRNKRNAASTVPKVDPFYDRYNTLVLTAGRIAAFPAFVLAILTMGYLRGGDGSAHPGVGYESQPRDAPRTLPTGKGLLPPYGDQYMSWIANRGKRHHGEAGDALLDAAALSQSTWDPTPFRDSAHKRIVTLFGKEKFCYPPETRSIKAVGRHVNFLLDSDIIGDESSILTLNPLTGRELLDMAPPIPVTALDILLGRKPVGIVADEGSCDNSDTKMAGSEEKGREECNTSDDAARQMQHPSLSEVISFLFSHKFLTPTIVLPLFDTLAFLSCVWWNYYYSIKMMICWAKLRGGASTHITA